MSTLETQLNYLYSIKRAIGRAITNKGVNITDSDTFYSYAEKIRQIAGDEVVIKSELTPVDSLEVSFLETYNSTPADNLDLSVVFLQVSENVSEMVGIDYGNAFARHINISVVNQYEFDDDWVEFIKEGIRLKQRTIDRKSTRLNSSH